jgi:glucokinase
MLLVADVGGTKTKIALFKLKKPLQCVKEKSYPSKSFDIFWEIVNEFLKNEKVKVLKACFGVAGPVKNDKVQATNLPWVIDAKELAKNLKLPKVCLINDLEANAWGIRSLSEKDFVVLNKGEHHPGNSALISAGTGLGEAGLYFDGKNYFPFACEGGHTDFAPRNDLEIELYQFLRKKYGHVSYERVVSGPGIQELYDFLIDTKKEKKTFDAKKLKDPTLHISEMGLKKRDLASVKALNWFISLYGSEAGNTALKFLALGGVFIGGGIAPKVLSLIKKKKLDGFSSFMESFVDKGRMGDLLKAIPVKVVLEDRTALLGCAEYALCE